MKHFFLVFLVVYQIGVCVKATEDSSVSEQNGVVEEAQMSVPELIRHKGYPVEIHTLVTSDGYVIDLHRIPHGVNNGRTKSTKNTTTKVVLLQHGVMSSSADWILSGPKKALGYFLADEGYDVWLGNSRGNKYGRNHTHLNPNINKAKFWDFSWHEIGTIDLPEQIDYILGQTGAEKLYHVGFGQGTTAFYVMLSEKPEYNRKISAHFSLAPIVYLRHTSSVLLKMLAKLEGGIEWITNKFGMHEFLPNTEILEELWELVCLGDGLQQEICKNVMFLLCGFSEQQLNTTMVPVLMGHTPSGTSTKLLLHYAQILNSGVKHHFRQYDYGLLGNIKKYGQTQPPEYKFGNVDVPIYVLYAGNDWLSTIPDVEHLIKKVMRKVKGKILVGDKTFAHLDFMYGIDAREYVYEIVVSILNRLS